MKMPDLDSNDIPDDDLPRLGNKENVPQNDLASVVRAIWMDEVRRHHLRRFGRVYNYQPGPRLDGGKDGFDHTFKPVWPKLADFITRHRLNPLMFIRAQFDGIKGDHPRSPLMLLGTKSILRYRTYRDSKQVEREIMIAKDSQTRAAKDAYELNMILFGDSNKAYKAMILDDTLPLSALFRYSIAYMCKFDDLSKLWFKPALFQYAYEAEIYDSIWGDLIPVPLKQAGERLVLKGEVP